MSRPDTSYRQIVRLSTPVMLNQLSYTAMGLIDTMMVGRVGVVALASVGLGSILFWWLLSLFWGMLAGVNTLVSQAEGANDRPAAGVAFWQGIYLGLFLSAFVFVLWPLAPRLMSWTGASPEVQANATAYMQIRLLGAFGLMLLMACDNFYRGIGRTDVPMWFGFVKLFLNSGANYVFIFGHFGAPALGGVGAAVGTAIANTVIGVAMFAYLFLRPRFRDVYQLLPRVRFHRRVFRALVVLSLPIGIQTFMEMGGFSVFTAVVARLGDPQLAATDAVIHAWSAAFMLSFGLSIAGQTLVGQCVGAGAREAARVVIKRTLQLGYLLMMALGLVYVLLPESLMALFVRTSDLAVLLPFARPLFAIVAVCLFFELTFIVVAGGLRGAGDTTYAMFANVASAWLVFVPLTLYVAPRHGLVAAWACVIVYFATMALLIWIRFRGTAWLKPAVARADSADPVTEEGPAPTGSAGLERAGS
jgi:MATE family multidrug resistance protein